MSRCTGHCCRSFCLPDFAAELFRTACFVSSLDIIPGWTEPDDIDLDYHEELLKIADMIIPLGVKTVEQACLDVGCEAAPHIKAEDHGPSNRYTCRHLSASGDCLIYEERPEMCKKYPSHGPCEWAGCTRKTVSSENRELILEEVKEFQV